MTETRPETPDVSPTATSTITTADADRIIMKKIRAITARGNNAEVKRNKDGKLTVLEVKKNIV